MGQRRKEVGKKNGRTILSVELFNHSILVSCRGYKLTAVELVGLLVLGGLLLSGIGNWVGDAAGLAELDSLAHVNIVDEKGGTGNSQDPTGTNLY